MDEIAHDDKHTGVSEDQTRNTSSKANSSRD